ncbi:type III-A CRISPR-associated RAMP protein Csm5 [Caldisericum sp.]|uniref:type III-A CRISPR-associated RAMP protein Csm5 n=1 Tax=Caldisericum sp. TaxID=2499687 RepID=UPI003D0ABF5A
MTKGKIKITTLTPIFIGSQKSLSSSEYFIDKNSNKLNQIDQDKLFNYLISSPDRKQILEEFIEKLKNPNKFDIESFFKEKKININDFVLEGYEIANIPDLLTKQKMPIKGVIKLFTKGKEYYYVPGSSIKGAIRMALEYSYYKNNKDQVIKDIRSLELDKKDSVGKLHNKLERDFTKYYEQKIRDLFKSENNQGENLNEKILIPEAFSLLKISDSNPIPKSKFAIFKLERKHVNGGNKVGIPVYHEGLIKNTNLEFDFEIDDRIFDIKEIENAIDTIKNDIISDDLETPVLKELINNSEILSKYKTYRMINLGFGGSMKTKSLYLILKDIYKENNKDEVIKYNLRKLSEKLEKKVNNIFESYYPTTRFIVNNQIPGWCLIKLEIQNENIGNLSAW